MVEAQTAAVEAPEAAPPTPAWRGVGGLVLVTLAAGAVAAMFRFSVGGVPDMDSYYHFRHAAIYLQRGLWLKDFPWLTDSLISQNKSDIAYGFHLLLVPFARVANPVLGLQLASIAEAAATLVLFYLALRRHRIAYAPGWPFVLFFVGSPIVFTFAMTRPQTLTMGFAALLLSGLIAGSGWLALVAAFGISFVHLNIALLVPVVVGVAFVVRGLSERVWGWRVTLFALTGMVLGWLARPNPLGALRIEYAQTVMHELIRREGVPLLFGREWTPISLGDAATYFPYFLVCWLGMAAFALVATRLRRMELPPRLRSLLGSSLLLSGMSFALTVLNTKRGTPLWASFGVLSVAAVATAVVAPRNRRPEALGENGRLLVGLCLAFLCALMVWEGVKEFALQPQWRGGNPYQLRAAAEAISRDSRPGDIVYNVDWSTFPELFFWNAKNYYVSGLDPIFLYAFNRGLYWKTHHLTARDTSDRTCPTPRCEGEGEDTYQVLTRDFGARYVVLAVQPLPALYAYLRGQPKATEIMNDGQTAVFRLGEVRRQK